MYKIYKCGQDFLSDNGDILSRYLFDTVFFEVNAKNIKYANSNDFLIRIDDNGRFLIAVHSSNFPMVIFGDKSLCSELAKVTCDLNFTFNKVFGALDICEAFLESYEKLVNCKHTINHSMDIMRCDNALLSNIDGVEIPTDRDVDELTRLVIEFTAETLGNNSDAESVKKVIIDTLSEFAIVRKDGKIVSLASKKRETDLLTCIGDVYTLPQYRNQGLSCRIVTYLTKQIIDSGKTAYLFVDKTNPVSNHLYQKIGYTYVLSQYEIKLDRLGK